MQYIALHTFASYRQRKSRFLYSPGFVEFASSFLVWCNVYSWENQFYDL